MMISYLIIFLTSQSILQYHRSNLFHLVGFRVSSLGLQVQDLLDAVLREDVVVAANAFAEAQVAEQLAEPSERDVCIRGASQDSLQDSVGLTHDLVLRGVGLFA